MPINFEQVAVLGFFALVGFLLFIDRKNIEFNYGLIIRRWKRGQYIMDKWIASHKSFLEIFGTVGVIVGFVMSIVTLAGLLYSTSQLQGVVQPVLPEIPGVQYPGNVVLDVPFFFWLIAIVVALSAHEPMHAIFARLAGIKVKSWGVMTFLVIPLGAFVDPEMKKLTILPAMKKLKILAGGSFGNFLVAGAVFLTMMVWVLVFYGPVITMSTMPGSPAADAGIEGTLLRVNGVDVQSIANYTAVMEATPPGTQIEVITTQGQYQVTTIESPKERPGSYIGLMFSRIKPEFSSWAYYISMIFDLLQWVLIFNLGIGSFNVLPIKPFDGGHMFEVVFQKLLKDEGKAKKAIYLCSIVLAGVVIFNILTRVFF